jgi:hypothetical protein
MQTTEAALLADGSTKSSTLPKALERAPDDSNFLPCEPFVASCALAFRHLFRHLEHLQRQRLTPVVSAPAAQAEFVT